MATSTGENKSGLALALALQLTLLAFSSHLRFIQHRLLLTHSSLLRDGMRASEGGATASKLAFSAAGSARGWPRRRFLAGQRAAPGPHVPRADRGSAGGRPWPDCYAYRPSCSGHDRGTAARVAEVSGDPPAPGWPGAPRPQRPHPARDGAAGLPHWEEGCAGIACETASGFARIRNRSGPPLTGERPATTCIGWTRSRERSIQRLESKRVTWRYRVPAFGAGFVYREDWTDEKLDG